MTKKELALQYRAQGCNCCQAVACAFSPETGTDPETLKKMAAGFGSGMGGMQGPCGALVGAGLVMGLCSDGGRGPLKDTKVILEQFRDRCGAILCKDLKGVDTGTVLCTCPDCICNAVELVEERL